MENSVYGDNFSNPVVKSLWRISRWTRSTKGERKERDGPDEDGDPFGFGGNFDSA